MHRITSGVALPALLAFGMVTPGIAGEPSERPVAVLVETRPAWGTVDRESEAIDSNRFLKRYESTEADGILVDFDPLVWAGFHRAVGGMIAAHRLGGHDTAAPPLRLPLSSWVVSSPFGMRADPFKRAPASIGPTLITRSPPARSTGVDRVNIATPLGKSLGLSAKRSAPPASRMGRRIFMHEGVDFVAPPGTPVFAAGAGTVRGVAPNGGYGNWILIEHDGTELTTVYGHLAGFAPGITPGAQVSRGEMIGFVGSTGRSTGPHLHFELRVAGKPVNPMTHQVIKPVQTSPSDLASLVLQKARSRMKQKADKTRVDDLQSWNTGSAPPDVSVLAANGSLATETP